jgi:hypothetical protein
LVVSIFDKSHIGSSKSDFGSVSNKAVGDMAWLGCFLFNHGAYMFV